MSLNRTWDAIVACIVTLALTFFVGVPPAGDMSFGETLMWQVYEVEPKIDRNEVFSRITHSLLDSGSVRDWATIIAAIVVFIVIWSRVAVGWLRQDFAAEIYRPLRAWLSRTGPSEDAAPAGASETTEEPPTRLASYAAKSEHAFAEPSPPQLVQPAPAESLSRATRATVLCDVAFAVAASATLFCFVFVGVPDRNGIAAVLAGDIAAEYPTIAEAPLQNQFAELVRDHDGNVERMFAGVLGMLCALLWFRPFAVMFRGAARGSAYPTV